MRYISLIILILLSVIILRINFKLHSENFSKEETRQDILLQLNFLEDELKNNNLGDRMQQIFPEGYIFINALYGLSWCELALSDSLNECKLKEKAIKEALYAYDMLDHESARHPFDSYLIPENGIFNCGWKNYLLSKLLCIDPSFNQHEKYKSAFEQNCNQISKALENSDSPYLESYQNQCWPADMFVAMASLSNFDKLYAPAYTSQISNWLNQVKERLDSTTQMIPHKADSKKGELIQGSRGCSIGLILRMLPEIDPVFAQEQFNLFKEEFASKTFGLPSIKEYPKGIHGLGDIDSGPVIFGVGFSATIVSIGTFSANNYSNHSSQQYKTIHAIGFDRIVHNQKKYLLGKLR